MEQERDSLPVHEVPEGVVKPARPLPEARYVRVGAGDYVVPVALEDAGRALLCTHLNGRPLAVEHGGPWRLLVPGGRCYTSVKWVDCLELTAQAGPDSGRRIALSRTRIQGLTGGS